MNPHFHGANDCQVVRVMAITLIIYDCVWGGERVWCKVANVKYDGMIVMCQGMSLFFGRLFVIRFALCYRPLLCPVCDIGVLWPNGWMDQNETWHGGRPRPRPHCVRWGPSSLPKRGTAPNFRPVRQATVLDGDPAPPQKRGHSPHPIFGPCLLWPNGHPPQLLLSSCL